jgi:hypothetical protein
MHDKIPVPLVICLDFGVGLYRILKHCLNQLEILCAGREHRDQYD